MEVRLEPVLVSSSLIFATVSSVFRVEDFVRKGRDVCIYYQYVRSECGLFGAFLAWFYEGCTSFSAVPTEERMGVEEIRTETLP